MKLAIKKTIQILPNYDFFEDVVSIYNRNPINNLIAMQERQQDSNNCTICIAGKNDEDIMVVVYISKDDIMLEMSEEGDTIIDPISIGLNLDKVDSHKVAEQFSHFLADCLRRI